ncbi:hypothetical protein O181_007234 [Austropuccinia psidii MF-1]|uniref:Large ribosomal subunit protein mL40 n=1 Tax=Austropuccinia psidii MF-1 TaxID=1389203 RepID=A0A9Q3BKJ4_9BASI|nr:hypothetical protein [Austropuccinia psidii MF-1]
MLHSVGGGSRLVAGCRNTPGSLLNFGASQVAINPSTNVFALQVRLKVSSRQTGGKSKSGSGNENRSAQSKGYLKKGKDSRSGANGADGKTDRFEVIRQMLYDHDPKNTDTERLARLQKLIPDFEMHETIHRAWQLHQRHQRERKSAQLERQYRAMTHALEELRLADRRLYVDIIKNEHGAMHRLQNIVQPKLEGLNSTGKLVGLFPRQMKVPSESLPSPGKVWDHDWKNPMDPLTAL